MTQLVVSEEKDLEPKESWFRSWFPYFRWVPTSPKLLKEAEENILSYVSTKSEGWYVESSVTGDAFTDCPPLKNCKIWTRRFKSERDEETPLVMIHGMGAGLGFFSLNFDRLVQDRTVYAIDLPGFGRSSRCSFNSDPALAEFQYISALEKWREQVGLKKMILLGHSFGGYLSAAYALRHPNNVQHLILADPWGFLEKPVDLVQRYNIPFWVRAIFAVARHFNPLATLRLSGPFGPSMIKRLRPDLIGKFDSLFPYDMPEEERFAKLNEIIPSYLFHCNAHSPSGESAFHSMMTGAAWAKHPMFPRLENLSEEIPTSVIYGGQSWVTTISKKDYQEVRKNKGHTEVHVIPGASHHVYAEADAFNSLVLRACNFKADENLQKKTKTEEKLN